ncbi:MAG: ATP-binding cassette domain-containing protein [Capsulimonadaceae bacterium]
MPVIEARDLRKEFHVVKKGSGLAGAVKALVAPVRSLKVAVDGISLDIEGGEIVGYLGPNGAGKSTTIKMLTGILHPTSGGVRINGVSPHAHRIAVTRTLGVVFGQRTQLYWDVRLGESFELLRRIYRVDDATFQANLDWASNVLGLGELVDVPVRQLSLGQRMRGELAAAMLHSPPILFLDEPTIGLDLEAKKATREFILEINRTRGTTVILTTHDLDDVERLCRRLIVINHGKIVEDGPLEDLVRRLAPNRVLVIDLEQPVEGVRHPYVTSVKVEGARMFVEFDRNQTTAARLIADLSMELPIRDLSVREPDIEDVVKRIYDSPAE